jgi:two-component SAPR family response regulator
MSTDNFYFSYIRLVDINMSSINGYELVEKIVKLNLDALPSVTCLRITEYTISAVVGSRKAFSAKTSNKIS